jgi:hypothetical protein
MRWAGHVARVGEMKNEYIKFRSENLRRRDYLGDLCIDGKIILE